MELEPKIEKLLRKHNLDKLFSLEDLELMIYNCPKGKEFRVFDPLIRHLKRNEDVEEVLMVLHNELWNHTPLKMLGGKSPWQTLPKSSKGPPLVDDWLKVSELLLSVQGSFQDKLYSDIKSFSHVEKKEIFSHSHFLFQRYLYSAIEDRPGAPSWQDIINEESKRLKVKVPPDHQISVLVFETPRKNPRPQEKMRMTMGITSWEDFPVIHDLSDRGKEQYFFRGDGFYAYLLGKLTPNMTADRSKFIKIYLSEILHYWWSINESIHQTFKFSQWYDFWWGWLQKARGDWCSTDEVFGQIIDSLTIAGVATDFITSGFKGAEGKFRDPESDAEHQQEMMFYFLGVEYALYFLTPLTTYLPLLEIHYIEPFNVDLEIKDFRSFRREEAMVMLISKPASQFKLRPLGRLGFEASE